MTKKTVAVKVDLMVFHILHIDDDPVSLELVKAAFAGDQTISVVSCSNADDALAIVESLNPDLIITDLAMPNMGGLELALNLKQIPSVATTPLVFLSGRTLDPDAYELFHKLSDVVLQKPVDPSVLRQKVKTMLEKTAQQKIRPSDQPV